MANHANAVAGCQVVGEYVDEAEIPTNLAVHPGEAVPTNVVASYREIWETSDQLREFTVLLNDGRTIAVRGHGLKSDSPHGSVFSIVVRNGSEEVVVALFNSGGVSGIFHGEMQPARKIA